MILCNIAGNETPYPKLDAFDRYGNVFRETNASWPRTKSGLAQIRERYPNCVEPINMTALLATMGLDRPLAKEMFDKLGDTYLPAYWSSRERFAHFRHWAETGKWQPSFIPRRRLRKTDGGTRGAALVLRC